MNRNFEDSNISLVSSGEDVGAIISLHFAPGEKPSKPKSRFYRDKIRLFLEYDPESVLLIRSEGIVAGFLIYTQDLYSFKSFAGPRHLRFYLNALKVIGGFYGYELKKYYRILKQVISGDENKSTEVDKILSGERTGKIWALIVSPDHRRKGVARELIRHCLDIFRNKGGKLMLISVKKDNVAAIRTYENCGFKITGECLESTGKSYLMEIKA